MSTSAEATHEPSTNSLDAALQSPQNPKASDVYHWLLEGGQRGICEAFDAHVVASILSLALTEGAGTGQDLVDGTGLKPVELAELFAVTFPHAAPLVERLDSSLTPTLPEDERCLRELLVRFTTQGTPLEERLAALIARRCQRPNHLWQDLGLRHRRELSWLMERHFESLAARNQSDMKWKKFLYRTICKDDGFLICASPVCEDCSDYDACFGDEHGECLVPESCPDMGGENCHRHDNSHNRVEASE